MSVKVFTVWRIFEWDGGDRDIRTDFLFTDKQVAETAVEPGGRIAKETICILDTLDDLIEAKEGVAREKALNKLSPHERKLLGVS